MQNLHVVQGLFLLFTIITNIIVLLKFIIYLSVGMIPMLLGSLCKPISLFRLTQIVYRFACVVFCDTLTNFFSILAIIFVGSIPTRGISFFFSIPLNTLSL